MTSTGYFSRMSREILRILILKLCSLLCYYSLEKKEFDKVKYFHKILS